MRLHHVQVGCPPGGEDAARRFYGHALGIPEVDKPPVLAKRGGCWFRAGGQELHVGVDDAFVPARRAHPGLVVSDLDELAARLGDAGFTVAHDDSIHGTRRFHVADPFGNRLEFRQG